MPPGKTKSIERLFFGEEYQRAPYNEVGSILFPERTNEAYITNFLETLDEDAIRVARIKVALDFSYGVASTILPNVLGALGRDPKVPVAKSDTPVNLSINWVKS